MNMQLDKKYLSMKMNNNNKDISQFRYLPLKSISIFVFCFNNWITCFIKIFNNVEITFSWSDAYCSMLVFIFYFSISMAVFDEEFDTFEFSFFSCFENVAFEIRYSFCAWRGKWFFCWSSASFLCFLVSFLGFPFLSSSISCLSCLISCSWFISVCLVYSSNNSPVRLQIGLWMKLLRTLMHSSNVAFFGK